MPEGDTIHRVANVLRRALAGRVVTGFEIVAPRIFDYPRPAQGWDQGSIGNDPAKARAWIRWAADRGVDGFKLRDPECGNPEVTAALLDEADKRAGLDRALGADLPDRSRAREHERVAGRSHGARDRHALLRSPGIAAAPRRRAVPARL